MYKRILSWIVTLMMLLSVLAGCSSNTGSDSATNIPNGTAPKKPLKIALQLATGGLGDKSFNDNAMEGMERAKKDFGIEFQYVEPKEVAEFLGYFRDFAKDGTYDMIIGIGFDKADAINAVAPEFPNQKFVVIDCEPNEMDNVVGIKFKDNEKAFLTGIVAGGTTQTDKIGVVGGMDIPLINALAAGFKAGAAYGNRNVDVQVKYVGSWNDANTAKELALSMYDAGADMVYQGAGGSGLGVFSAAADAGKLAIGSDVNQILLDPDAIFLSSIRRVDVAIYNEIEKLYNGIFEPGNHVYGLKEGVVSYTVEGAKHKAPQEAIDAAEAARQDIIDGKIKVPMTLEEADAFIANLP